MKTKSVSLALIFTFLVVVVSGCASSEATTFSRDEANRFVASMIELERLRQAQEVRVLPEESTKGFFEELPERKLEDLIDDGSCDGPKDKDVFYLEGDTRRLSDLSIEDFLHCDSRSLLRGAREGKYPFYDDGVLVWKHHTLRIFHHKLPWGIKMRLVRDVGGEARARELGLVLSKDF